MTEFRKAYQILTTLPETGQALFSPNPAWIWSKTGDRILWANEAGCAFFEATSLEKLCDRRFRRLSPAIVQIARVGRFGAKGAVKEQSLRFVSGLRSQTLSAQLSNVTMPDGQKGVFVLGTEEPIGMEYADIGRAARRLIRLLMSDASGAALYEANGTCLTADSTFRDLGLPDETIHSALKMLDDAEMGAYEMVIEGYEFQCVFVASTLAPYAKANKRMLFILNNKVRSGSKFLAATGGSKETVPAQSEASIADEDNSAKGTEGTSVWKEVAATKAGLFGSTVTKKADAPVDDQALVQSPSLSPDLPLEDTAAEVDVNEAGYKTSSQLADDLIADTVGTAAPRKSFVFRKHNEPTRFLWELDSDGCISRMSDEFSEALGPNASGLEGSNLVDLADAHALCDGALLQEAIDKQTIWTRAMTWPVEGRDGEKLSVPLSLTAMPIFNRDREFEGYRGFGSITTSKASSDIVSSDASQNTDFANNLLTDVPDTTALSDMRKSVDDLEAAIEDTSFEKRDAPTIEEDESANTPAIADRAPLLPALQPDDSLEGLVDCLPVPLLVSKERQVFFANRAMLNLLEYDDIEAFSDAGGMTSLFEDRRTPPTDAGREAVAAYMTEVPEVETQHRVLIRTRGGETLPVDARRQPIDMGEEAGLLITLNPVGTLNVESAISDFWERTGASKKLAPPVSDTQMVVAQGTNLAVAQQSTEILDIASDGILIVKPSGALVHTNASAQVLFGFDLEDLSEMHLTDLFDIESRQSVADYLDGMTSNGVTSVLKEGREVVGLDTEGNRIALFMTMGRIQTGEMEEDGETPLYHYCAVLRDISLWKQTEAELVEARRQAEEANEQKSAFLTTISHEIRTPLNAIIGFSEVMMEQQFGPLENEQYQEYAKDIHMSGSYLVSLVNDLLDLSKIEAGKLELDFGSVEIKPCIQECVSLLQGEAQREQVVLRTSLDDTLPPVVADARSMRQIVLNLLSNAVKFTKAGGQVIISSSLEENGDLLLKVRDTGPGMTEEELEQAMQPFRQIKSGNNEEAGKGTGLGLPLTKALVEANRAEFSIESTVDHGTLIQVTFPNARVLAE